MKITTRKKQQQQQQQSIITIRKLIIIIIIIFFISISFFYYHQINNNKEKEKEQNNKENNNNNLIKIKRIETTNQIKQQEIKQQEQEEEIGPKINSPIQQIQQTQQTQSIKQIKQINSNNNIDNNNIYKVIEELFHLGKQNPSILANKLINENPFNLPNDPKLFECPKTIEMFISLPDIRNHTRDIEFRQNKPGTWLFYQHLRKAGGTGFCDLAQNNIPRQQTPPYFCMIDNRGSLATSPWNNEEYLISRMEQANYRITANEWDAYYPYMGKWKGAVLATTFRHPIDRWYSQYRFEHLEHRDGSSLDAPRKPFRTWYNNNKGWTMGINYYVTTFIGLPDTKSYNVNDFYWTYHKYQTIPLTYEMFLQSLKNLLTFHLVLITEWLDSSPLLTEEVLGWKVPPKKVLPHESNFAKRNSSYTKISIKDLIGENDYNYALYENIFDLLLYNIMKKLYLERLHSCHLKLS